MARAVPHRAPHVVFFRPVPRYGVDAGVFGPILIKSRLKEAYHRRARQDLFENFGWR